MDVAMIDHGRLRERLKNWARVYRDCPSGGCQSVLGRYADLWREQGLRSNYRSANVDVEDAERIERAVVRLDAPDLQLIRDWYVKDWSIGKIARKNKMFYQCVILRLRRAEQRLALLLEDRERDCAGA